MRILFGAAVLSSIGLAAIWIALFMRATGNAPVDNGWREFERVDYA